MQFMKKKTSNMDYFCNACLTNGRTLVNVFMLPLSLQDLCKDLQMSEMSKLCWECKAELYRIEHFKQKVKYANDLLNSIDHTQSSSTNILSLSKLCVSNRSGFDYEITGSKPESFTLRNIASFKEDYGSFKVPIAFLPTDIDSTLKKENSHDVNIKDEPENFFEDLDTNLESMQTSSDEDVPLSLQKSKKNIVTTKSKQKSSPQKKFTVKNKSSKKSNKQLVCNLKNDLCLFDEEHYNINFIVIGKINMRLATEDEMMKLREKARKSARFNRQPYRCTTCVIQFGKIEAFNEHNRLHSDENGPFKCRICAQRFGTEESLITHIDSHYRIFVCTRCSYENFRLPLVTSHVRKTHKKNECKKCKLTFNSIEQFKEHNKQHDYIKCNYCNKMIKNNWIKGHIRDMHEAVNIKCEICNKSFRGQHRLNLHKKNIHEKNENLVSFYCVECDIHFKTKYSYRVHVKHSKRHCSDRYECDHCQKQLASKLLLIAHIQRIHTENKTVPCPLCDKKFGGEYVLKKHMSGVHTEKKRRHVCDFCGKAFMSGQTLKQHKNSHLGIRPYKCDMCSSSFNFSGALFTHKKLVHFKYKNKTE